jgi:hypothetical protein
MRSNRYFYWTISLFVLTLSSCSVQTNFLHPNNGKPATDERAGDNFPSITPEVIQETPEPAVVTKPKTVKRTLCSPFVIPAMPERPRVDLSKLAQIPGHNHDAVKDMLLDNIQAMNEHSRQVEAALKEAYRKHRATCATREVLVQEK